jgi:hypothetical protein
MRAKKANGPQMKGTTAPGSNAAGWLCRTALCFLGRVNSANSPDVHNILEAGKMELLGAYSLGDEA